MFGTAIVSWSIMYLNTYLYFSCHVFPNTPELSPNKDIPLGSLHCYMYQIVSTCTEGPIN